MLVSVAHCMVLCLATHLQKGFVLKTAKLKSAVSSFPPPPRELLLVTDTRDNEELIQKKLKAC